MGYVSIICRWFPQIKLRRKMKVNQIYKVLLFSLFLIGLSDVAWSQTEEYRLQGLVTDASGNPLINISIGVEGVIKIPANSNKSGEFELMVPSGNVWLLVTATGDYKSKRIYLNYKERITIRLVVGSRQSIFDNLQLALDSREKRNITGSVEEIQMERSYEQPLQTVDQFLIGRATGMYTLNHSGMAGVGAYSYMRGIRSIYSNNQPLMIIDGIPLEEEGIFSSIITGHNYDPISSINHQNVTSLAVLKDAGSLGSYSYRATNGAVLIETLKPTETRTSIDFLLKTGYSLSPDKIPLLNNNQFRTLAHEILATSKYKEEDYPALFPGLYNDELHRYSHNTNWQNEIFRNTAITDAGLAIKGGDAISKYGLSVGFLDYNGIVKNTDYSSINLQFVGSFNVFKWLTLNVSTNMSNNSSNLKETGFSSSSPILTGLLKAPVMAPYRFDEDGQELSFLDDVDAFGVSNPAAVITKSEAFNKNFKFLGAFNLIGDITEKLKWNSLLGLNFGNMKEGLFLPNTGMESYLDEEGYNEVRQQASFIRSLYLKNYLGYSINFANRHALNTKAGFTMNTNHSEQDFGIGYNTPSDEYTSLRFTQDILSEIGGSIGNWNRMSFIGRIDYAFEDRYFMDAALSMGGSSRTGKDAETPLSLFNTPFGLFYSVNGAWRISNESFLKDQDWIDELKLRVSYGLNGNDDIGNFNSRRYYQQVKFRETTGVIMGTYPVTDLKFEEVHMLDVGVDYSMLGERFNLAFDFFDSRTKDLLIFERQKPSIGYEYLPTNGGELRNTGFEAGIDGRIIHTNLFSLDIGFNVSAYTNSVVAIKGDSLIIDIPGGQIISKPGFPVNSFYGLVAEGVFINRAEAEEAGLVNDIGLPYQAGDIRYSDLSGPEGVPDGVINEYDRTIIGSPNPDFFGGISINASYRRWTLQTLIQFVVGNDVYNFLRYQTEKMSNLNNQSTAVLNRWQYEGHDTNIPRAAWSDPMNNSAFSTRWIEDGSYMRIKHITLAYTIPEKFLFFDNMRVFTTVMNPFNFTKYLGYDPEFSYGSQQLLLGVDYGLIPQTTTFLTGIRVGL